MIKSIEYYEEKLSALNNKIIKIESLKEVLEQQIDDNKDKIINVNEMLDVYEKVQILLQKTSHYAREQIKSKIENIVNEALNIVFGVEHSFIIELKTRANQPTVEFWLEENGIKTILEKPDYDKGGGKIDVISLTLRLALIELQDVKGIILLDEIGKMVSKEYSPNVAYFLKEYCHRFGRQILLITHNQDLAQIGDNSLLITIKNGISKVNNL